mmetsp:Transcript_13065/g.54876  ORF Transcript_13065/g.54876 Transcript_13065/m.54876 type:complete len:299 (-) Transcript_13065:39-935(-)
MVWPVTLFCVFRVSPRGSNEREEAPSAYASTASTTAPSLFSAGTTNARCSTPPPTFPPRAFRNVTVAWSGGSLFARNLTKPGGMVALKHAVRVLPPGGRQTSSTSRSNPPSKSRSHSSKTWNTTPSVLTTPRSTKALIRPGVPITTRAPFLIPEICGFSSAPPQHSTHLNPPAVTCFSACSKTCAASSRVGKNTIALGKPGPLKRASSPSPPRADSAASSACARGSRYASVFPEPVGACTSTSSRSTMIKRRVRSCTGVRCVIPASRRRDLAASDTGALSTSVFVASASTTADVMEQA